MRESLCLNVCFPLGMTGWQTHTHHRYGSGQHWEPPSAPSSALVWSEYFYGGHDAERVWTLCSCELHSFVAPILSKGTTGGKTDMLLYQHACLSWSTFCKHSSFAGIRHFPAMSQTHLFLHYSLLDSHGQNFNLNCALFYYSSFVSFTRNTCSLMIIWNPVEKRKKRKAVVKIKMSVADHQHSFFVKYQDSFLHSTAD